MTKPSTLNEDNFPLYREILEERLKARGKYISDFDRENFDSPLSAYQEEFYRMQREGYVQERVPELLADLRAKEFQKVLEGKSLYTLKQVERSDFATGLQEFLELQASGEFNLKKK